MCNFIEWQDKKVVYKRYASLYFVACVDNTDNELIVLEMIHLYVEILDRYFGNVCELDIIFNFHKVIKKNNCSIYSDIFYLSMHALHRNVSILSFFPIKCI